MWIRDDSIRPIHTHHFLYLTKILYKSGGYEVGSTKSLLLQAKPQSKRVSHRWKIICYICSSTYCYFRWFLTALGTTSLWQDCMVVSRNFLPRILPRFLVKYQNHKFLRNFHQTFWLCNDILVRESNHWYYLFLCTKQKKQI